MNTRMGLVLVVCVFCGCADSTLTVEELSNGHRGTVSDVMRVDGNVSSVYVKYPKGGITFAVTTEQLDTGDDVLVKAFIAKKGLNNDIVCIATKIRE